MSKLRVLWSDDFYRESLEQEKLRGARYSFAPPFPERHLASLSSKLFSQQNQVNND